jgi:hypothetical protein
MSTGIASLVTWLLTIESSTMKLKDAYQLSGTIRICHRHAHLAQKVAKYASTPLSAQLAIPATISITTSASPLAPSATSLTRLLTHASHVLMTA